MLCNIPAHRTRVITFFAVSLFRSLPPFFVVALFAKFSTTTARRKRENPNNNNNKTKTAKINRQTTVSHFQNNRTVRETAAVAISLFLSRKGKTMRPFLFTADKSLLSCFPLSVDPEDPVSRIRSPLSPFAQITLYSAQVQRAQSTHKKGKWGRCSFGLLIWIWGSLLILCLMA